MNPRPHLLVFRFSAMGDVAMLVPVFRGLFERYPNLRITFVSTPHLQPLFAEFDRLHFFEFQPKEKHNGIGGLWKIFQELKSLKPVAIADLHAVIRSRILSLFFRLFFYKVASINKGRKEKKALTSYPKKLWEPLASTHYRYASVFTRLGFEIDLSDHLFPSKPSLHKDLRSSIPQTELKWIGIAPFASFAGKTYPMDLMQQVVAAMSQNYQVILFGAAGKEAQQLQLWEKAYPNVYSVAGKVDLAAELSAIAHLDLMISMDSANGHMAANYNVPVITVWGLTHPYAGFAPFRQPLEHCVLPSRKEFPKIPTSVYGNKIPKGYEHVMRSIQPKEIIDKAVEVLKP